MDIPPIYIQYTITRPDKKTSTQGRYNFADVGERRACAERFNKCLLDGYTVTTVRVK